MFIVMAISYGGYLANIIQFGLDQLQDVSTSEITAFIRWYVWTYYSSCIIFLFAYMCVKEQYHPETAFSLHQYHCFCSMYPVWTENSSFNANGSVIKRVSNQM